MIADVRKVLFLYMELSPNDQNLFHEIVRIKEKCAKDEVSKTYTSKLRTLSEQELVTIARVFELY